MKNIATPSCPICHDEKSIMFNLSNKNYQLFFCGNCNNGFTYPKPKNLSKYYTNHYWISNGILGKIKNVSYFLFQLRRKKWITSLMSKGKILDVGSGTGNFSKSMPKTFNITNIDPFFKGSKTNKIVNTDLLNWKTNKRFDAIVFWESLEHVANPQDYLKKAAKLLKKNGLIFIECPNYKCLESRIFGKNWFHLDMPRHMSHLTKNGLSKLFTTSHLTKIEIKNFLGPEYTLWGFAASILLSLSTDITTSVKNGKFFTFLLVLPLLPISLIMELIFFVSGESPLMLAIAKK